jgi:hypothetical protein
VKKLLDDSQDLTLRPRGGKILAMVQTEHEAAGKTPQMDPRKMKSLVKEYGEPCYHPKASNPKCSRNEKGKVLETHQQAEGL